MQKPWIWRKRKNWHWPVDPDDPRIGVLLRPRKSCGCGGGPKASKRKQERNLALESALFNLLMSRAQEGAGPISATDLQRELSKRVKCDTRSVREMQTHLIHVHSQLVVSTDAGIEIADCFEQVLRDVARRRSVIEANEAAIDSLITAARIHFEGDDEALATRVGPDGLLLPSAAGDRATRKAERAREQIEENTLRPPGPDHLEQQVSREAEEGARLAGERLARQYPA